MSKTVLKHKVALILGADLPAGRAAALQLARAGVRVVAAGLKVEQLEELVGLIVLKHGDALTAPLPKDLEKVATSLRVARETVGHFHFILNALPSNSESRKRSEDVFKVVLDHIRGRGGARLATVWPDDAGQWTPPAEELWHSLVRVKAISANSETADEESVRASALGDALVQVFQCPPAACPVEIRLEPRPLKLDEEPG